MDLIEKLGLEKCQEIVSAAPDLSPIYDLEQKKYVDRKDVSIAMGFFKDRFLWVSDIKLEVDQWYYGQSEEKEIKQYAALSQEKIEGGAVFVGDNSAIVQAMWNIADDCADIRNHISPLTGVIEK